MAMTDDKLLARARKATPGPWRYYCERLRPQFTARIIEVQQGNGRAVIPWPGFDDSSLKNRNNDARYIAAANPSVIIAMIERHRAEVAGLTERNNRLVSEAGAYDDLLAEMRQRAEAAEAQVERLKAAMGKLHADIYGMQDGSLLRDLQAEVERLTRERDNAKTELDMTRAAEFAERDRAEQAESAFAAERKRVDALQTALFEAMSAMNTKSDGLRAALAGKEPGNGSLEGD